MDGTSLSQCPINPGETFLYDFNIGDQAGTFMYHGHLDSMQRADGVFGAFIVDDPDTPLLYDEERYGLYHSSSKSMSVFILNSYHISPSLFLHIEYFSSLTGITLMDEHCQQD